MFSNDHGIIQTKIKHEIAIFPYIGERVWRHTLMESLAGSLKSAYLLGVQLKSAFSNPDGKWQTCPIILGGFNRIFYFFLDESSLVEILLSRGSTKCIVGSMGLSRLFYFFLILAYGIHLFDGNET